MHGEINPQASMFSHIDLKSRTPKDLWIRNIRDIVDTALQGIEPWLNAMCAVAGRPPWICTSAWRL